MKYILSVNQLKLEEWDLTLSEGHVFGWLYEVPSWAESVIIAGQVYYFASRNKAVEELRRVTTKTDTMYRHYKTLRKKGLILLKKIEGKDYVSITEKGASWYFSGTRKNIRGSDIFPDQLGNKSGNDRPDSEIFPTDKDTSPIDKETSYKESGLSQLDSLKDRILRLNLNRPTVKNRETLWKIIKKYMDTDEFKTSWRFISDGLPAHDPKKALYEWIVKGPYNDVKTLRFNRARSWADIYCKNNLKNTENGKTNQPTAPADNGAPKQKDGDGYSWY